MWSASSLDHRASSILALASGAVIGEPPNPVPPSVTDPRAASEQATRAMNSSVVMRARWRVRYAVNGVEGFSPWADIGEPVSIPAGAVYLGPEFDGEVIDGGPWYVIGGEPRT